MLQLRKLSPAADSIRIQDEKRGYFKGYASVFNGIDAVNDTILPGAYKSVLASGAAPKMFWNHRMYDLPVGKYLSIVEDETGLLVEGELTPGNRLSDSLRASMKHGTVDGLSVQIGMLDGDYVMAPDGNRRYIKNISRLPEISVCTMPCDDAARIDLSSVKSMLDECKTVSELEDFLREAGSFSRSSAKAFLARAKAALREADVADPEEPAAVHQLLLKAIPKSLTGA